MSKRFVSVPADRLLGLVREIGESVKGRGGRYEETLSGREVVADITPPNRKVMVRVYTSLAYGADEVRDCGKDAVRVVVVGEIKGKVKGVAKPRKMLRTAPRNLTEDERVSVFLTRLKDATREAYAEALRHPTCPECGSLMALREGRNGNFYGCTSYPDCRATKNVRSAS